MRYVTSAVEYQRLAPVQQATLGRRDFYARRNSRFYAYSLRAQRTILVNEVNRKEQEGSNVEGVLENWVATDTRGP